MLTAGTTVAHIVEETTGWSIREIISSRLEEYSGHKGENPTEIFGRVLLRSIGKQAIDDPDRNLDPLSGFDYFPAVMNTMIHMIAWLPAHCEIYQNVVDNYSMD